MKRCLVCEGNKTVIGMGNMKEKCKACNGKGFLPETEKVNVKEKEKQKKGTHVE